MNLRWSSNFKRSLKQIIRQTPQKKEKFYSTILQLQENPFQSQLHTHKLKGELKGCWSCYIEYDLRIVFTFVNNPHNSEQEILLLDIGSHDEVY